MRETPTCSVGDDADVDGGVDAVDVRTGWRGRGVDPYQPSPCAVSTGPPDRQHDDRCSHTPRTFPVRIRK